MQNATPALRHRRATRYAVVLRTPDDRPEVVVGFTMRKSRPGLMEVLRSRGEEIVEYLGLDDDATMSFATQPLPHAFIGKAGWAGFTGETERDHYNGDRWATSDA